MHLFLCIEVARMLTFTDLPCWLLL